MKRNLKILFFCFGIFFSKMFSAREKTSPLLISHLTGNFYIYTTYNLYKGEPVPSNSMYLVTDSGVVMFDTPWDSTQFQPLCDSIEKRHHKKIVLCIATHFHADRTAGLDFLKKKGVKTFTSLQTFLLCKKRSEKQSEYFFVNDTTFSLGTVSFKTFYPGEGHTKDNIVLWFEKEKILYGSCLVKSTESTGLGNIADANIAEWETTIKKLQKKFPAPKYVIPGHFSWKNNQSLKHTLKLLTENKKEGIK